MRKEDLVLPAACILLGLVIVGMASRAGGVPPRERLERARGKVAWVTRHRHGVRFGLTGNARHFGHSSKGRHARAAERALRTAGEQPVSVLFDPADPAEPAWSDERYFHVWHLEVGATRVFTWEEISAAWRQDDQLGRWLGWAFIVSGAILGLSRTRFRRDAGPSGPTRDGPRLT